MFQCKRFMLLSLGLFAFSSLQAQSFSGKTQWINPVDVNSSVAANVQIIHVKQGQKVNKGDLLITLDNRHLSLDYDIAAAEALALSPIKQRAEMDLNRAFELYDRTLLSDVDLKLAEFEFAAAKGDYDVALAKQKKAQLLMDEAKITAPISGSVLSLNVTQGAYINPQAINTPSLVTLVDSNVMYATAYLKASQWSTSLVHKKATVLLKKKSYKGRIESISLVSQTNDKGLSEYAFYVSFKAKDVIPSGMPVTINIQ